MNRLIKYLGILFTIMPLIVKVCAKARKMISLYYIYVQQIHSERLMNNTKLLFIKH